MRSWIGVAKEEKGMRVFDCVTCLGIKPSYLKFMPTALGYMYCSFLEIRVLSHFTRTLPTHSITYWVEELPLQDWEGGKLFSLQEQIDHKVSFIRNELQNTQVPIVLVGHSIGSYICVEILRSVKKVTYFIGLYPFLRLNTQSLKQTQIGKIAGSSILSVALSFIVAWLGLLPSWASRFVVKKSVGTSWSNTAVEATCTHLLQYHMMRNLLFLAMTEFRKLSEAPDWNFMRENASLIAFLFGVDDHWGPLAMFEEISRQAPDIALSVERESHTHSFCCTEAGSLWVARHVATLIKSRISPLSSSE